MTQEELESVHAHTYKNRDEIVASRMCVCLYCLQSLPATSITEWCDSQTTALCPLCGVDAVIGDVAKVDVNYQSLADLHAYWFGHPKRLLRPPLDSADRDRELHIAETIAILGHFNQKPTADGLPYIEHPRSVVAGTPFRFRPAAWLHDILEDTSFTSDHLHAAGISKETIEIVEIVSRRGTKDQPEETYEQFIYRIAESENVGAIVVKLADLKHNLRPSCPESLRERYLKAVPILEQALRKLESSK